MRLKYLANHIDERNVSDDTELLSVSKIKGVVPRSEVSDNQGRAEDISHYKTCKPGDLVINRMAAYQGALGIANRFGAISPDYMVLRFKDSMDSTFVGYLFKSSFMTNEMSRRVKGIGSIDSGSVRTPRLSWTDLGNVDIPVPHLEEQKAIADFLDTELAQIDQLIDTKINLVRSLQQRYNSYLCEVTTRGLNSAVEKNACDIEWAPNKPKHWVEVPFFTLGDEVSFKNRSMEENNLLSLSYGEIVQKDIETNEGLLPESFETYQIIDKSDLVFRFTDLQNDKKSLRSAYSTQRGIITSAYLAFRPKNCNPEFLSYQMRAWDLMKVFYAMGSGLRQSLKFSDVKRMPILLPPIDEQNAIVKALKAQHQVSQKLQTEVERAIELLKERRSTLISEAVTGKVTTRGTN